MSDTSGPIKKKEHKNGYRIDTIPESKESESGSELTEQNNSEKSKVALLITKKSFNKKNILQNKLDKDISNLRIKFDEEMRLVEKRSLDLKNKLSSSLNSVKGIRKEPLKIKNFIISESDYKDDTTLEKYINGKYKQYLYVVELCSTTAYAIASKIRNGYPHPNEIRAISTLFSLGADPRAVDESGMSLFELLLIKNQPSLIKVVYEYIGHFVEIELMSDTTYRNLTKFSADFTNDEYFWICLYSLYDRDSVYDLENQLVKV